MNDMCRRQMSLRKIKRENNMIGNNLETRFSRIGADDVEGALSVTAVAAENIAAYDVVALNSSDQFVKADASDAAKIFVVGIAPKKIDSGTQGTVMRQCELSNANWTWTAQSKLYLSDATAGRMSHDQPLAESGNYSVLCALTRTSKKILFNADLGSIVQR